jgi:hypothetical protein
MRAVLGKRRFELDQQVFRHLCRMAAALQPGEQFALPFDVPNPERDVVVHHLEIGAAEGHARL